MRNTFKSRFSDITEQIIINTVCDSVAGIPVNYAHSRWTVLALLNLDNPFPKVEWSCNHSSFCTYSLTFSLY